MNFLSEPKELPKLVDYTAMLVGWSLVIMCVVTGNVWFYVASFTIGLLYLIMMFGEKSDAILWLAAIGLGTFLIPWVFLTMVFLATCVLLVLSLFSFMIMPHLSKLANIAVLMYGALLVGNALSGRLAHASLMSG